MKTFFAINKGLFDESCYHFINCDELVRRIIQITLLTFFVTVGCNVEQPPKYEITGEQSRIIKEMIDAVNEQDAKKYVKGFADEVQVFVESEMKVDGRANLMKNRAKHFESHPNVRSEIQHLVEIDNKVIMHDKVWFEEADKVGQNIVEVFTFENEKVVRVDVIQPKGLFQNTGIGHNGE
ncbi:nuclear transport factor 2 family protein [Tunicatimonas pelagia]|uniref:nuclear transport factor 2 family protein n=1 Tax=Tunicatimonas pelagia TaxID=931531 RepID=UPI002665DA88|nr:nuclear transport factor 2 family protein [Tunicatimonas pelagia]WKN43451.1 nuclear transport factor 2 family protein [Tunicatimonas pelagia]